MKPIDASETVYEKVVFNNLPDRRQKRNAQIKEGQSVRTVDNEKTFSKRDSANWSYILYSITEVKHDIIPR